MKPLGKVKIIWSSKFAYAIGLLVTDGNLSKDGRHIDLTSKDKDQLQNFINCLDIEVNITSKHSGSGKKYLRVQFGDRLFYDFLLTIGLMPNKTKVLKEIKIPGRYFFDFLRGHFDGDGTFYSYWDPRWRSSFMFYTVFISASQDHILWLRQEIFKRLNIVGHITKSGNQSCYQLKYAKKDSLKLLKEIYRDNPICLKRKLLKINRALSIINKHKHARVV